MSDIRNIVMCERARARVLHTASYISKEKKNECRIHLRMHVLLLLLCEYDFDLTNSIASHSLAPFECLRKRQNINARSLRLSK